MLYFAVLWLQRAATIAFGLVRIAVVNACSVYSLCLQFYFGKVFFLFLLSPFPSRVLMLSPSVSADCPRLPVPKETPYFGDGKRRERILNETDTPTTCTSATRTNWPSVTLPLRVWGSLLCPTHSGRNRERELCVWCYAAGVICVLACATCQLHQTHVLSNVQRSKQEHKQER